ncbi:YqxM protein [Bacillus pakistanensis]|uniref:YqxM protein n=1 Tax=Rossellomorea pakistanensis TaxID=992288 RepID=A0ABS2NFG9_9BACI|nr:hypothetical protein [Bacillus pakistanensis]MBM7586301.1 YqxM protein [Bacillus pakistanensis]
MGKIETWKLTSSEKRVSINFIKIFSIYSLLCFNLTQLTVPTSAVFKDAHEATGVIKTGTWTNTLSDKSEKSKLQPPSRETTPKALVSSISSNPSNIEEQQRSNTDQIHPSDYSEVEKNSTENKKEKDLSKTTTKNEIHGG